MASRILRRIATTAGAPGLVDILADDLPASDLQSLLLAVLQRRSRSTRLADIAARAVQPLCAPSPVDARAFHAFDEQAFTAADAFDAVDLSPVMPLGTTTALGGIDPNNVLTTIRRTEVPGDNTSALALTCAGRRRPPAARASTIRLCSSHRVVRLQPFDVAGYSPHFRLFALASAGRDRGSQQFECAELLAHISCYLTLMRALNEVGYTLEAPLVEIAHPRLTAVLLDRTPGARARLTETVRAHRPEAAPALLASLGVTLPADIVDPEAELEVLLEQPETRGAVVELGRIRVGVVEPLSARFPEARFRFTLARLEGLAYYCGPCVRISPRTRDGARFPVVDGGLLDWTARLLNDRKERFLASGIGTEFVCTRYRTATHPPARGPRPRPRA